MARSKSFERASDTRRRMQGSGETSGLVLRTVLKEVAETQPRKSCQSQVRDQNFCIGAMGAMATGATAGMGVGTIRQHWPNPFPSERRSSASCDVCVRVRGVSVWVCAWVRVVCGCVLVCVLCGRVRVVRARARGLLVLVWRQNGQSVSCVCAVRMSSAVLLKRNIKKTYPATESLGAAKREARELAEALARQAAIPTTVLLRHLDHRRHGLGHNNEALALIPAVRV